MKAIQLKSHIHEIVDRIQSEQLLQALYDFLRAREKSEPGTLWESLTELQKQEVLASYDESEDESNLIETSSVFKKKR